MANRVTAHNSIANVRNGITDETRILKKCFQDLFAAMKCNMMKDAYVTNTIDNIKKQLKTIDNQLCAAQQAATALAGVNRKVTAKNVSFNVSAGNGSHKIDISIPGSRQSLEAMMNSRNGFIDKIDTLNGCKNEISSLPVSDQILSSLSVIELFFPALAIGKVSKAVIVSKVKQTCVDSIASAIKSLKSLSSTINDFAGPEKRISKLLNEFDSCENNVFNRCEQAFVKKYKDITSAYTESNVPEEGTLQNSIKEITAASAEWSRISGQQCRDLDDEVVRLQDLYDNNYGGIEAKIKKLKDQDGFRDGEENPYNYNNPTYKGHTISGANCFAIAAIFQYECTGVWGHEHAPIYINNDINQVKVGDMVRYEGYRAYYIDKNTGKVIPSEHWGFVYKIEEADGKKKLYLAEGNAWDPETDRTRVINYDVVDANSFTPKNGTIKFTEVRRP